MTATDHSHKYLFIVFSEKIRLDVSSESSARQRILLKNQALFSSKDNGKKLKCPLLQFLFVALRVKFCCFYLFFFYFIFFFSAKLQELDARTSNQLYPDALESHMSVAI